MTAAYGPSAGRTIVRIDPNDWSLNPFISDHLVRPIDVRFNAIDGSLYILDFGRFEMSKRGVIASPGSGRLWKVIT
jgi:hypothetical protein